MMYSKLDWALIAFSFVSLLTILAAATGAGLAYDDDPSTDLTVERSEFGDASAEDVHWLFRPGVSTLLDASFHYAAFVATLSAHLAAIVRPVVPQWIVGGLLEVAGLVFGAGPLVVLIGLKLIRARNALDSL